MVSMAARSGTVFVIIRSPFPFQPARQARDHCLPDSHFTLPACDQNVIGFLIRELKSDLAFMFCDHFLIPGNSLPQVLVPTHSGCNYSTRCSHAKLPKMTGAAPIACAPSRRWYSRVMQLSIELASDQAERLRQEAERLGIAPDELARAAVSELLSVPDDAFQSAAERVLRKNRELYRRLARDSSSSAALPCSKSLP
jgi:hypothetical protein